MSTTLYRRQGDQFFTASGAILAGGKLNYYRAGTTTPQATYSDQAGVVPNANPVVLNSAGRLTTPVFLGSNYDYKEVLTDADDVTISPWPFDNIPKATGTPVATGFERVYLPWTQVTTASSPVTLLTANAGAAYECDATAGAIVFNLPSAATIQAGTGYYFKRVDASAYLVTVVPSGAETIDGVNAAIAVPPGYHGVYLISDGAAWQVVWFQSPQARLWGTRQTITANSSTLNIDMALGWYAAVSLAANVTTFTVSNWPASGSLAKLVLEVSNAGAYNITDWPGTTVWSGGAAPTLTSGAGKKDTLMLTSLDGGSNFRGYVLGLNMS